MVRRHPAELGVTPGLVSIQGLFSPTLGEYEVPEIKSRYDSMNSTFLTMPPALYFYF